MPEHESDDKTIDTNNPESALFAAISAKNLILAKEIIDKNSKINLDCLDKDQLTPLQHACHLGDKDFARFLIERGARVNFTQRKDGYTALMFAAISGKTEVVRVLLEFDADRNVENCVNRTAAQMAAFVGQSKIVTTINSWVPYRDSVEAYTKCRELEEQPRIPSPELGRLLHEYIVYPSVHPVKILLFIKENVDLIRYAKEFIYVLENLSYKSLQLPCNDENLAFKYYYLSYLIDYCSKYLQSKKSKEFSHSEEFDKTRCEKNLEILIRRLIKKEDLEDPQPFTKQSDQFMIECLLKFPYQKRNIFKYITGCLSKLEPGSMVGLGILSQVLRGPSLFNVPPEICAVCGEMDRNKKCSRCKSIYYCGKLCQNADWFQHKRICK